MSSNSMQRLLEIMSALRDPDKGCPWDLEQSWRTIVPHTIEEAYEVADAIERDDFDEVKAELGDLLFQVVFYAQLAKEEKRFSFDDIVNAISDKLVHRHPHVFGDVSVDDADAQTEHWEALKAEERKQKAAQGDQQHSALDGIAHTLPAMNVAEKIQKRAARVGFDWPDKEGVFAKVEEELAELKQAWDDPVERKNELGDLLFSCVNLARHAGFEPESVLRQSNRKFEQRFRAMEQTISSSDQQFENMSIEELEAAWQHAKTKTD
ncbi:MAG: nucleoside triphosphate pyrophosphohydrolase [Gammaproteobacteria bacterium]|nr:nucleoside triphosphate pyrophosphohydrolase [Gammaproteobacteria bacterium]MDH5777807.1 nucleoside triphosphate pyrophosphohydrolase [Gammaproteobacteria bacterium]